MKEINGSVEVNSRLKQLKTSVEVENNTIGKSDRTSDSLNSRKSKKMIWRFVYNVCGYHHTPIPPLVASKLKVAHPSPLFQNISVCKRLLSNDNLVLRLGKLTAWIKWLLIHCLAGLHIVALCLRNNLNNSQSGTTSINDIHSNSPDNDYNLQSINNENQSYENRLTDYTYNNMILSNITKI